MAELQVAIVALNSTDLQKRSKLKGVKKQHLSKNSVVFNQSLHYVKEVPHIG